MIFFTGVPFLSFWSRLLISIYRYYLLVLHTVIKLAYINQDSITYPFFGLSAWFESYQPSCQVSFQPSVGIIQPFICRVTYIQPYCASECINIGFNIGSVSILVLKADIPTLLCKQNVDITLFQPSGLPKYLSFHHFNPVVGWVI